jgi:hypothetical protein
MLPTLDKDTVEQIVVDILESGTPAITSLELKTILRNSGFWAVQSAVSRILQELVQEGVLQSYVDPDWQQNSAEPYQLYFIPFGTVSDDDEDEDDEDDAPSTLEEVTVPDKGDWELSSYLNTGPVMYIKGGSRNQARAYYEKQTGEKYAEVRCSLVR